MHVLLFLKAPEAGKVKTRLAETLGNRRALRIYRKLVEHQLKQIPEKVGLEIHFSPADKGTGMKRWLGEDRLYVPQCGGTLGDRLLCGVRQSFAQHGGPVVCIGADCPGLTRRIFEQTGKLLESGADVVAGPTEDGGYYLLGMNRFIPELFLGIPWSSSSTLPATLKKAEDADLKVHLLEVLRDVDVEADWKFCEAKYFR